MRVAGDGLDVTHQEAAIADISHEFRFLQERREQQSRLQQVNRGHVDAVDFVPGLVVAEVRTGMSGTRLVAIGVVLALVANQATFGHSLGSVGQQLAGAGHRYGLGSGQHLAHFGHGAERFGVLVQFTDLRGLRLGPLQTGILRFGILCHDG